MPTMQAPELVDFGRETLRAAGAPADVAQLVSSSLVRSNLLGHDSHGVASILKYVGKIRSGELVPAARPSRANRTDAVAVIDGAWGFGQLAARLGTSVVADLADSFGVGSVALSHTNHIGRVGEYVEALARRNLVGMALSSGAARGGAVAPFGGRQRIFGTNPIAMAVPAGASRSTLVVDFATSAVAAGKLSVALDKGETVAPGLLLDSDGNPSTDPASFFDGGALLPFGEHKGYGLMLMVEILATLFAGAAPASSRAYIQGNPTLFIAWRVDAFVQLERFTELVEELLDQVEHSQPAADSHEVLLPGAPEMRTLARRERDGIPIPEETWRQLTAVARELGRRM